jgi:ribosomal protein S18 acetylase RimI-like enzyme
MTEFEASRGQVSLRRAGAGDAERLAELCGQLDYPLSPEQLQPRLVEIGQGEPNDVYVAVGADGRVLGWVQVYVRQLLMVERHAEMGGLVVDEACRGRGIGRMLVDWAEAWAREHGCESLYLRSNVQREAAHRFYERMGYQLVKTQRAYWKLVAGYGGAAGPWVPEPPPGGL